jgi:hypothetical protein
VSYEGCFGVKSKHPGVTPALTIQGRARRGYATANIAVQMGRAELARALGQKPSLAR